MTHICNVELWQTEHPKLLISYLSISTISNMNNQPISESNVNLLSYINSKFMYIEQAYKRAIDKLYYNTIKRRCELNREVLKNRLLTAPLSPNTVGWIIKQRRGYAGRILGEVLYLIECKPKVVSVRRTDKCYQELPISINNQSKFMAPVTHIIQHYAEEIECNILTPPLYYINEEWIGFAPNPIVRKQPDVLEVLPDSEIKFSPLQSLGMHETLIVSKII